MTPHVQTPNPVQTLKLDEVLKPWLQVTKDGFDTLHTTLKELKQVMLNLDAYMHEQSVKQKQTSEYDTVYSNGIPYTVRYRGRRYMDVMGLRTDDNTQNVTFQALVPGLGQSKGTQLMQIISMYNMLLAGVSPWVPLNFPEGAIITIPTDPGGNTQQQCLYVRYGMEQWGQQ